MPYPDLDIQTNFFFWLETESKYCKTYDYCNNTEFGLFPILHLLI